MYNENLADAILKTLDEAFPTKLDLKRLHEAVLGFSGANEEEWVTALVVLNKSGMLEGSIIRRNGQGTVAEAANLEITRAGKLRVRELSRKNHEFRVDQPSDLDGLLQIYTRARFDSDLARMSGSEDPISLIMVRLDQFNKVIEICHQSQVEEVLKAAAILIKHACRNKGPCYRYSGDEFAVLVRNYTPSEARALAERIRESISKGVFSAPGGHITARVAVATLPDHAADAQGLECVATEALSRVENLARNSVRVARSMKSRPPHTGSVSKGGHTT